VITVAVLIACGVDPAQARVFAEPLALACERFDITTPPRAAGFIGQMVVETQALTKLEEDLTYRSADRIADVFKRLRDRLTLNEIAQLVRQPERLANQAYAGVNGNGDVSSGDGWRYRGRGLKQLTGRSNYLDAEVALGRPYIGAPELVALPPDACLTAAWYWHNRKCNVLADSCQWDAITKAVNGAAMLQKDRRRTITEEALQVLQ
jgi:putative chitinase